MTDTLACSCHDHCSGVAQGRGCVNEPAPHGGYRPPYLAARQPVRTGLRVAALRVVRAEPDCCGDSADCGDPCGGA